MSSLALWRGQFGNDYTDRHKRWDADALRMILRDVWGEIDSVLEVGCNRGDNLAVFTGKHRVGVEPNARARALTNKAYTCLDGHAGALPFADGSFDIVFTAGVLIHIAPPELNRAMYEINRVSRRFILAVEYHAGEAEAVEYRGQERGIWKRNYAAEYMNRHPLRLIDEGTEDTLLGTPFEGCSWQLFDKRP